MHRIHLVAAQADILAVVWSLVAALVFGLNHAVAATFAIVATGTALATSAGIHAVVALFLRGLHPALTVLVRRLERGHG
jgi:hypothetical protein